MAYFNPSWFAEDEHAEYINGVEDLAAYNTKIDREIERLYLTKGIRIDEIPVDGSGHLTSRVAQAFAVEYALFCVFRGYWGKRRGENDIYYEKMIMAKSEADKMFVQITQSSLLGLTDSNGDPKCSNGTASMVAV